MKRKDLIAVVHSQSQEDLDEQILTNVIKILRKKHGTWNAVHKILKNMPLVEFEKLAERATKLT